VIDPFSGSGTTGIAARQLGCQAVLVEMREAQCEAAALRFQRETAMPIEGIA
jgi:site-specific DNA-methyltransferase (adenine-specific)